VASFRASSFKTSSDQETDLGDAPVAEVLVVAAVGLVEAAVVSADDADEVRRRKVP
jgi:hypothetical protein